MAHAHLNTRRLLSSLHREQRVHTRRIHQIIEQTSYHIAPPPIDRELAEHPVATNPDSINQARIKRGYEVQQYPHTWDAHRLILKQEYTNDDLLVSGIVTDIQSVTDRHYQKHWRVLLVKPYVHVINAPYYRPDRYIEDHLWLLTDNIEHFAQPLIQLSTGDTILFTGKVNTYSSIHTDVWAKNPLDRYKQDIRHITLLGSGWPTCSHPRSIDDLITDYPRYSDWLLAYNHGHLSGQPNRYRPASKPRYRHPATYDLSESEIINYE